MLFWYNGLIFFKKREGDVRKEHLLEQISKFLKNDFLEYFSDKELISEKDFLKFCDFVYQKYGIPA